MSCVAAMPPKKSFGPRATGLLPKHRADGTGARRRSSVGPQGQFADGRGRRVEGDDRRAASRVRTSSRLNRSDQGIRRRQDDEVRRATARRPA